MLATREAKFCDLLSGMRMSASLCEGASKLVHTHFSAPFCM